MSKITITHTDDQMTTAQVASATAHWDWAEKDGQPSFGKIILDGVTCGKGGLDLAANILDLALAKIKEQAFFADTIIVTAASTSDLDGVQSIEAVVAFYEAHGFRVSDEQGGDSVFMERLI